MFVKENRDSRKPFPLGFTHPLPLRRLFGEEGVLKTGEFPIKSFGGLAERLLQ